MLLTINCAQAKARLTFPLPGLRLHFGEVRGRLFHVLGKIGKLLHLENLDDFVVEAGQRDAQSMASCFEFTRIIQ